MTIQSTELSDPIKTRWHIHFFLFPFYCPAEYFNPISGSRGATAIHRDVNANGSRSAEAACCRLLRYATRMADGSTVTTFRSHRPLDPTPQRPSEHDDDESTLGGVLRSGAEVAPVESALVHYVRIGGDAEAGGLLGEALAGLERLDALVLEPLLVVQQRLQLFGLLAHVDALVLALFIVLEILSANMSRLASR